MDYKFLLVLNGEENDGPKTETLSIKGVVPVVKKTIREGLEAIVHHHFVAVLIYLGQTDIDALEFVLNVRDYDCQIPIVVLGHPADYRYKEGLLKQPNVIFAEKDPGQLEELIKIFLSDY